MPSPSSTLYINGTIITVNETRDSFVDGAILVVGNRIVAIGKTAIVSKQALDGGCIKTVDLGSQIVIPGQINAHAHIIQSLIRGLAEDMGLHRWACHKIWPIEASYQGMDGYAAARLSMAEMLKTGTTCFLEPMLPSSANFEIIAKAVDELGIRACLVGR